MPKKIIIRLLTIHQTIFQPKRMEQIIKSHHIQLIDIDHTRKERQKSPSALEIHHMIYRDLGGSSKQRNEVAIPAYIHRRIHKTFPEMLPHQMITTTDTPLPNIYRSSILPELGITSPKTNPIVEKYHQNNTF